MKLDVIKNARLYITISTAVILAGIVAMVISFQQLGSPLRLGIDFTGGSSITLAWGTASAGGGRGEVSGTAVSGTANTGGGGGGSGNIAGSGGSGIVIIRYRM